MSIRCARRTTSQDMDIGSARCTATGYERMDGENKKKCNSRESCTLIICVAGLLLSPRISPVYASAAASTGITLI